MIEDSKMEKKINGRSVQLQPKTQVSDCKKSVDTTNKPWLRQGKKREVNNVPIKNDVRKAVVQKGRSFDKRPKPRGAENNSAVGGTEDTGLNEYDEAEFGSVFVQGSKKQNLNHLLNFRVAPRKNVQWQTGPRSARPRQNHISALVHSNVHRHNKELFLQSNCQFVVRADGDYSVYLVDPDIPVNWDTIEMIIMQTPDGVLTCPICLCESQAAHVTRCGHAYCWACVLHYLALADPPGPRPCPVCSQYIDAQYLKSVQSMPQHFTNVGEMMEMRLMRRLRNSTVVEPAPDRKDSDRDGNGLSSKNGLMSLSNMTSSTQYAKLLTADKNEVLNIIRREVRELHYQLENEIDTSEVIYIEQALGLLDAREKAIDEVFRNVQPKVYEIPMAVPPPFVFETSKSVRVDNTIDWFDVSGMDDVENGMESSLPKNHENDDKLVTLNQSETLLNSQDSYSFDDEQEKEKLYEELEKMSLEEDNSKYYYFYQAADGQLVFLSGINQRMLYSSWGDEENKGPAGLARAPTAISGKILHRLSGSVSNETRKRLKWLSHLPLHCPFDIVELEMSVPAVTQEALDEFRDELVERALSRERAERAERRRAQRCGRQLRRQAGAMGYPRGRPNPAPPSLAQSHWAPLSSAQDHLPGPSPPQYNGPSFAKMASSSGVWTVRPCTSASDAAVSAGTSNVTLSEDDSDCPHASSSYTMDLSEAISAALKNTTLTDSSSIGKKKKKQKPKLLFSSGI